MKIASTLGELHKPLMSSKASRRHTVNFAYCASGHPFRAQDAILQDDSLRLFTSMRVFTLSRNFLRASYNLYTTRTLRIVSLKLLV